MFNNVSLTLSCCGEVSVVTSCTLHYEILIKIFKNAIYNRISSLQRMRNVFLFHPVRLENKRRNLYYNFKEKIQAN
jgi:hypothetical protein